MVAADANLQNNLIGKKHGSMNLQQRASQLCGLEYSWGQASRTPSSKDSGICSNY